jgi:hypothetical protein
VETERISAKGLGISRVRISPVAFELTKRRTRRDFAHFFKNFNTSRTQERSAVISNSQATSPTRYIESKPASLAPHSVAL